jgi:hypothetical protein
LPAKDLRALIVLETEKAPAVIGAFLITVFNCIGLTITKNHFGETFILLMGRGYWGLGRFGGLTCDFAE